MSLFRKIEYNGGASDIHCGVRKLLLNHQFTTQERKPTLVRALTWRAAEQVRTRVEPILMYTSAGPWMLAPLAAREEKLTCNNKYVMLRNRLSCKENIITWYTAGTEIDSHVMWNSETWKLLIFALHLPLTYIVIGHHCLFWPNTIYTVGDLTKTSFAYNQYYIADIPSQSWPNSLIT